MLIANDEGAQVSSKYYDEACYLPGREMTAAEREDFDRNAREAWRDHGSLQAKFGGVEARWLAWARATCQGRNGDVLVRPGQTREPFRALAAVVACIRIAVQ